jgi:wobble nucleotide-excising tRNase
MIHKVERLTSIGKFRDFRAAGDISFKKLTLIYADNGAGKATLASVFRSLTQGRPDIILRRLSTNHTSPQAAQIIQRDTAGVDTHHTFRVEGWTIPFPDIEIFDVHFVNNNIYSGFEFNDEHKKQLHDFVVGAQGVAIKQQIEQNKADKTASRQLQEALENRIIQEVQNGLTNELLTSFLNLTPRDRNDIDNRIAAAETDLRNAKANAVIQTMQPLSQQNGINLVLEFSSIVEDLLSATQTIHDKVLQQLFEGHCKDLSDNSIEGPERWIRTGYTYIEKKGEINPGNITCPFCGQPVTDELELLRAYSIRFDAQFNALVQRLQTYLDSLQRFNIELYIQSFISVNQTNTERATAWATHLPNTINAPAVILLDGELVLTKFQEAIASIRNKSQNPSVPLTSAGVNALQTHIHTINAEIETYNQAVASYNRSANAFRLDIKSEQQAQNEVNSLNRIKQRHEAAIDAICGQLALERQNLRRLEQAYPLLIQQQQAAATAFFITYRNRINYYFETVFRTPFRIDQVVHIPPQGRATQSRIDYNLTIDGHIISCDSTLPLSTKNCLSEGDKNTIAFAFFLSKLDIDQGIGNKIVVIDDPLTSFDTNRKLYTVQLIQSLLARVKQVIVLRFFLSALSNGIPRGDKKTLLISENFTNGSSGIEPLDLDTLVQEKYFRDMEKLDEFLANPNITIKDEVLGLMRNVLEAHILFKFYRQTRGIPPNERTFGRLISELVRQNVLFRNDTVPPTIISKMRMLNSVSCKPHHGEPMPNYAAIGMNPNTITVTELANLVLDTMDLIDNLL